MRWKVSDFLLVSDAFFDKSINLFLVVLNVINCEYFTFCVATEQSKVLISLTRYLLVDPTHDPSSLALLRQLNIALDLLYDFNQVNFFGGDNVSDIGVDGGVLLKDFLVLEVDSLVSLVFTVLLNGLEA
jgi:hypothetical protein